MKVLILNGNPKDDNTEFDEYLDQLTALLRVQNHASKLIMLRKQELHDCIGCYTCWLKTPGICCFKDDMANILKEYLATDLVILASPIIMHYTSALLKRVFDRFLPFGHPFLVLRGNKMGHVQRYSHYPKTTLLLGGYENLESEGIKLIEAVYKNSVRGLEKIWSTHQDAEVICNEIVSI